MKGASVGVGPVRLVGTMLGTMTVPLTTGTTVALSPNGTKGLYPSGVAVEFSPLVVPLQAETSKTMNNKKKNMRRMPAIVPKSRGGLGS